MTAESGHAADVAEQHVERMLRCIGEDTQRDGLVDTPKRVAKAVRDSVAGYGASTASVIGTAVFHEPSVMHGSGGTVLVRNIEFASTCEATLMPFHGQCHIAYHPSQPLVLGLSKLARLVGVHSKRLGSQQGLTAALHDAIATHMPSLGVFVYTRARHLASAASAAHSVCQSTSGCFASAQAPQAKEVLLMLQLAGAPLDGAMQPTMALADSLLPVSCERKASLTGAVHELYASVLPAGTPVVSSQAAGRFVECLLSQTRGYSDSLAAVVARHSAHAAPGKGSADGAGVLAAALAQRSVQAGERLACHSASAPAMAESADSPASPASVDTEVAGTDAFAASALADSVSTAGRIDRSSESEFSAPQCAAAEWHTSCSGRVAHCDAPDGAARWGAECVQLWRIRFASQCEHHMLPFYGCVHVCLRGSAGAVGELTPEFVRDVVDLYSCRLQVQERITHQVADALAEVVGDAAELLVVCDSAHMCMVARGVEKHASATMTIARRGAGLQGGAGEGDLLRLLQSSLRDLAVS